MFMEVENLSLGCDGVKLGYKSDKLHICIRLFGLWLETSGE